jgi:hypothetical protein
MLSLRRHAASHLNGEGSPALNDAIAHVRSEPVLTKLH